MSTFKIILLLTAAVVVGSIVGGLIAPHVSAWDIVQ